MNRPNPSPVEPQQPKEPSRSSFLPMLLGIASLLVILQAFGLFKTIDNEKTTSEIDMRSGKYLNQTMPARQAKIESSQEKETLKAIAEAFEGNIYSDIRTANTQENWGLSEDEAHFYERIKQYYQGTGQWLNLVKQSRQVYQRVKAIFGGQAQTQKAISNPQQLAHISNLMAQYFNIDTQQVIAFAQSGQGEKISDWAFWIMTK